MAQGCDYVFKLPGKYNMSVGNQTARAFFWFYSVIFFYFPLKVAKG